MKIKVITLMTLFFLVVSCAKKDKNETTDTRVVDSTEVVVNDDHNAKNSLDYIGVYEGILPCADCEGIETILQLENDESYILNTIYLVKTKHINKTKKSNNEVRGVYTWNDAGNTIVLSGIENAPNQFFVGENYLTQLDMDGNKIEGDLAEKYVLQKISESAESTPVSPTDEVRDNQLEFKKWRLVELNGVKVSNSKDKPMFIQFNKENRYAAFAGCNNMMGSYEIKKDAMRIKFTKGASTMMACPDMTTEQEFAEMLEKVDNYSINGNNLSFNRARMAPLARFEVMK
jgi:heat shock protein HslJ